MTTLHRVIAAHGEGRVRADLAHLFGVSLDDVLDGRVRGRHALMLLGQTPAYADSLIREDILGSASAAHWDVTTSVVAHMADLMAELLAGLSKMPADDLKFPRPAPKTVDEGVADEPQMAAATIAEFDVDKFMRTFG